MINIYSWTKIQSMNFLSLSSYKEDFKHMIMILYDSKFGHVRNNPESSG